MTRVIVSLGGGFLTAAAKRVRLGSKYLAEELMVGDWE